MTVLMFTAPNQLKSTQMVPSYGLFVVPFYTPHCPNCGQIAYRGKHALGMALSTFGFCQQLEPTLPILVSSRVFSLFIIFAPSSCSGASGPDLQPGRCRAFEDTNGVDCIIIFGLVAVTGASQNQTSNSNVEIARGNGVHHQSIGRGRLG